MNRKRTKEHIDLRSILKKKRAFHVVKALELLSLEELPPFDANQRNILSLACEQAYKEQYDQERSNLWGAMLQGHEKGLSLSIEKILDLNHIDPHLFASSVRRWLLMGDKKKNTLMMIGLPNSGKTLLASCFRKKLLFRTWINSNSTSNFIYGNLAYCNLITIEEPFLLPTQLEDMKSLCSGAPLSVDMKYSQPIELRRTPVLITSNFENMARGYASPLSEEALRKRCFIFNFNKDISNFVENVNICSDDLSAFLKKFSQS